MGISTYLQPLSEIVTVDDSKVQKFWSETMHVSSDIYPEMVHD